MCLQSSVVCESVQALHRPVAALKASDPYFLLIDILSTKLSISWQDGSYFHCLHLTAALNTRYRGLTQCRTAADWPWEKDYSALLSWRKGEVKTGLLFPACLHFPFHPGKQGRVISLSRPNKVHPQARSVLHCRDLCIFPIEVY